MGKVKQHKLWWQLYRTSLPDRDLENFRPMDFCSTVYLQNCSTWLQVLAGLTIILVNGENHHLNLNFTIVLKQWKQSVLTATIKVVWQHSGTGFLCCTFKCFAKEATTKEAKIKYRMYSNARWGFFVKCGIQVYEVALNLHMKNPTAPRQTWSLWTGPRGTKPRPTSPNCHEISVLLGYYTGLSGNSLPMFWDNILFQSSRVKRSKRTQHDWS